MERTKEFGMPAVTMTDHGNLFGALEFYETAKAYDLKPIIGCEVYLAKDHKKKAGKERLHHLVLLVKNLDGYRNLLKLVSISYQDTTFSIAFSQQHPFIGFISSFVFAEVHIHSENTLNQL